jgi:hypothetical protein
MSRPEDLIGPATGWKRREEVLEAFEAAWQRGERPKLEEYLSSEPTDRTLNRQKASGQALGETLGNKSVPTSLRDDFKPVAIS